MNYADIKKYDVGNGPGVRISLFVSGCTHHCKGCFNPETWDFNYGMPYTEETEKEILDFLEAPYIAGLTLLGGEPLEQEHQRVLLPLLRKVKERFPKKNTWCFTGYLFDRDVLGTMCKEWEETEEFISYLDVLVDGEFEEEKKDLSLRFKGSSNQRTIMVKESLKAGRIVLWDPETGLAMEEENAD